jgi:hypothetical protein
LGQPSGPVFEKRIGKIMKICLVLGSKTGLKGAPHCSELYPVKGEDDK